MGSAMGSIGSKMGDIGSSIGSGASKIFGKIDPDATNTVDAAGNVVATGTPGASEVADPSEGLSMENKLARGLTGGLGKGMQSMNKPQQQGGATPINVAPSPYVDSSYFAPTDPNEMMKKKYGNNSMLLGG